MKGSGKLRDKDRMIVLAVVIWALFITSSIFIWVGVFRNGLFSPPSGPLFSLSNIFLFAGIAVLLFLAKDKKEIQKMTKEIKAKIGKSK